MNGCRRECCAWVFRDLNEREFQELVWLMRPLEYAKSEKIFRPGAPAFGCYLLCSGAVRLVQELPGEHRRQVVSLLRRPALFGEASLFTGQMHWTAAETLTPVRLAFLPRDAFLDYLKSHPALAVRLIEKLAREVKELQTKLIEMAYAGAEKRLAGVLTQLGEEFGRTASQGVEIGLELLRSELGEFAGLTAETTIRLLSHWADQGLITLEGRRIRLHDLERLRRLTTLAEPSPSILSS